jgi:hypothetical protein
MCLLASKFVQYFLKRTLCLYRVNSDLFLLFHHPNWRNGVLYYPVKFILLLSSQIIDVRALVLQNHPKSIRTSARTTISRTSASKWPATANIDFAHYYAVAKCNFEGSEFKNTYFKILIIQGEVPHLSRKICKSNYARGTDFPRLQ